MNISLSSTIFSTGIGRELKSTLERAERKQRAQSQIDFFEGQKAELKNMKCDSLDEIEYKLELFNNYSAQIMMVKHQYNMEEMSHTMDEAAERGEQIAKAIEKQKPKTKEEKQLEKIKEALGIDDDGGMIAELLDETLETEMTLEEALTEKQLKEKMLAEEQLKEESKSLQSMESA